MAKPVVIFQWGASSYFGWGVYGLNLMLHWARRPEFLVACSLPIDPARLALNPLERRVVEPVLQGSAALHARLAASAGNVATSGSLVLHALGNNLQAGVLSAHKVELWGTPTVGVVFAESAAFDDAARERAKRYALIVAGSSWNRDILEAAGIGPVALVLQGVDPTHFHPGPRAGLLADRFVVFSGGKLERRKGQDLVVLAFRAFAARHPEALLVTAWSAPWATFADSINANPALQPIRVPEAGPPDIAAWTAANGIAPEQVLHLGPVPNAEMPRVLREADVALFPNRAEGGTNLVAMEAMACGVPAILAANTGQRDLIRGDNCFALTRQAPVPGAGCAGWGESDVEEIVETLEAAWRDRDGAAARGRRGAETIAALTWAGQLDQLATTLLPYIRR